MLDMERGKGVITEMIGVRHMERIRGKVTRYNGNGGHIIYGRLTWRAAGQMSEDVEGPKGTSPIMWSSGE
jgi:hypothetical protein